MTTTATGSFEVQLIPQGEEDKAEGSTLGRMTIAKQFRGDLEATGKGEMLTAMTDRKGSAGYVAVERVTGALHGRVGGFVLQHSGTMSGQGLTLSVTVVPDSGTGALTGLAGSMAIGDGHTYTFEYTLPDAG